MDAFLSASVLGLCILRYFEILDTDSFINAFRRFVSRRGIPQEIWSANGTKFVGGEHEMQEAVKMFAIHGYAVSASTGVQWNFLPLGTLQISSG